MAVKKTQKKQKKPVPGIPDAWFLMCREKTDVSDLRALFAKNDPVDVWPLAGFLEIMISEKESIDIEMTEPVFETDADRKFLAENGVQSLFSVVFRPECYDLAEPFLRKIASEIDGFFCGDTPDFTPFIGK